MNKFKLQIIFLNSYAQEGVSIKEPKGPLQLPNSRENFKEYKQAISFLQNKKHIKTIYLMGHSMGSRMTSSLFSKCLS